jgi:arylsulfatase A-like enzyme
LLVAAAAGSAVAADAKRPNIVFIFSDDHAPPAISAYGDPRKLIETPNIDRLAKEGMRLDRCLVTNSICGPSRATVLTGKYSHKNGFYNNTNRRFDGSQALDAAGVPIPAEMQGRSLHPILAGQTPADWRKSFYYHYYEYPQPHRVRPHFGVVTDRYKLVQFYGTGEDYTELFDLQKDPQEMKSAFDDPAYAATQRELQAELVRLRNELQVPDQVSPELFGGRADAKKKAGNTNIHSQ